MVCKKSKGLLILALMTFGFICIRFNIVYSSDNFVVVDNQKQAEIVWQDAQKILNSHLGMDFKYPVKIHLVTGKELDNIAKGSAYKGRIVGLHTFSNGAHQVYMMKGKGRDDFFGTLCHEMTHGWQFENCPNQDIYLKEGLAVWVQFKCLGWSGAYAKARELNNYIADPIYGVGYRYVQGLENKYSEKNVLNKIKKMKNIPKEYLSEK